MPTDTAGIAALTVERARLAGLVPQEWCPGGNRCMKETKRRPARRPDGRWPDGRCRGTARWCDTDAAARYDRYHEAWTREPGSYAYKVCNRHALEMVKEFENAT